MKKFIFAITIIATVFVGCGSDDDSSSDDNTMDGEEETTNLSCQICGPTDGITSGVTNEYCDNGDGTVTVTVSAGTGQGVTTTTPLFITFEEFITALEETTSLECNPN